MANIAIFFDAENISAAHVTSILSEVKNHGSIVIQRAYADWSIENTKPWKSLLSRQPITAIQQFHNGEQQAVDKTIIMDAIQIASERADIDTFCIVASDKGYAPLALRLRELGKKVLGIGEEKKAKADSILVNACNDFKYIERLRNIDDALLSELAEVPAHEDSDMNKFTLSTLLSLAYDSSPKTEEGYVSLTNIAKSIKSFKPDFSYSDYGYRTCKQLLEAFADEYDMEHDDKTPPNYMVIRKESASSDSMLEGVVVRIIGNYGFIKTDDGKDYFFWKGNLRKEFSTVKIRKGMKVRFESVREPDYVAESTKERNGKAENVEIVSGSEVPESE